MWTIKEKRGRGGRRKENGGEALSDSPKVMQAEQ